MDTRDFLAVLAQAVTDANERERFFADPRGVLLAIGLDLPEWLKVTAREGTAPELAVTLPSLIDPDAELADEHLSMVSGGCGTGGCTECGRQWSAACSC
jgi:hypothetical protein